jgi:hypothetical protein
MSLVELYFKKEPEIEASEEDLELMGDYGGIKGRKIKLTSDQ